MGAYNPKYTLKEETEIVCNEMKGVIISAIKRGDLTVEEFLADPYSHMDSSITYGDKWYEKIIISRVRKEIFTDRIDKINEKEFMRLEELHYERIHENNLKEEVLF